MVGIAVEDDLAQRRRGLLVIEGVTPGPVEPATVTRGFRPFASRRTIDQKIESPMKTRSSMRWHATNSSPKVCSPLRVP